MDEQVRFRDVSCWKRHGVSREPQDESKATVVRLPQEVHHSAVGSYFQTQPVPYSSRIVLETASFARCCHDTLGFPERHGANMVLPTNLRLASSHFIDRTGITDEIARQQRKVRRGQDRASSLACVSMDVLALL